jgi:hypothetical protein
MATSTSKKSIEETDVQDLFDFDNVPSTESASAPRIDTPGIHHNLRAAIELAAGEYTDKSDPKNEKKVHWDALQLTLTDEDNMQHVENYFAPPSRAEDVKYKQRLWQDVDGKKVNTREATNEETLKILNMEYIAYLLDLGTAFGYKEKDIKEVLQRSSKGGFLSMTKAFIDKFKPADNRRISAKILWNNNDTKKRSDLQIHGSWPKYSPFGADLFDVWIEGRPSELEVTAYEAKRGSLVKKYTAQGDAPKDKQTVIRAGVPKSDSKEPTESPF